MKVCSLFKQARAAEKHLLSGEQTLANGRVEAAKYHLRTLTGEEVCNPRVLVSVDLSQLEMMIEKKRHFLLLSRFERKSRALTKLVRDEIIEAVNCPAKFRALFREVEEANSVQVERTLVFHKSQDILSIRFSPDDELSVAENDVVLCQVSASHCAAYRRSRESLLSAFSRLLDALFQK